MTEWIYKATATKVSLDETRRLADEFHFLCRSLYYETGEGSLKKRPQTQHVRFDDIIHFYYKQRNRKEPESIGSFQVVKAARHPERFGDQVEGTALVLVKDQALIELLKHELHPDKGYEPDPKHQAFMGWIIARRDVKTPVYPDELKGKRGRTVLAPLPSAQALDAPSSGARWSRITFDPEVMGGRPCIRGMRVTVGSIVGLLAAGRSVHEILQAYPYLKRADIHDALAYAAWRVEEQDLPLSVA